MARSEEEILVPLGFEEAEGSKDAQKDFDKGTDNVMRGFSKMKVAAVTAAAALATVAYGVDKLNQEGEKSLGLENMSRVIGETTEELREWEHLGAQTGIDDMIGKVAELSGQFGKLKENLETGNGSEFTQYVQRLESLGIDTSQFEKFIKEGNEMGFVRNLARQTEAKGLEGQDLANVLDAAGVSGMFNLFDQPFENFISQLNRAQGAVSEFADEADMANSEFAKAFDELGVNFSNTISEWAGKYLAPTGTSWLKAVNDFFVDDETESSEEELEDEKPSTSRRNRRNKLKSDLDSQVANYIMEAAEQSKTVEKSERQKRRANNQALRSGIEREEKQSMGIGTQASEGKDVENTQNASGKAPIIVQNMTIQSTAEQLPKLQEEIERDPTLHNYSTQKKY